MQHSSFYNQLVKDGTLIEFIQQAKSIHYSVCGAFIWGDSPSGNSYWRSLPENSRLSNYDISVLKNEYPEYFI